MRFVLRLLALLLLPAAALAQTPEPIATARAKALGTVVTVAGRVTVANEFGGPTYFQDATGGMPVFFAALSAAVQEGDSVVVTGPLSEFQATTGQPGTGLGQMSCPTANPTCITFTVVTGVRRPAAPRVVRLADLSEALEGQLLTVDNVRFSTPGTFQAGQTYALTDGTATVQVFVDNNTNLVGAAMPTGAFRIVGVLGQFRGTRQLQPRSVTDVGATPFVFPAENVPRSRTFEVVTWNVEFFGDNGSIGTDPDAGPDDEVLQIRNAARVLRALDADLYGLQEIVSTAAFRTLLDSLNAGRPGTFRGFIAPIRQIMAGEDPAENGQKTAFIYRDAAVDSVSAGFLFNSGDWAFCCGSGGGGRYPYSFVFDAKVEGATRRVNAVVIHAKAGSSQSDYDDRMRDVPQLKAALDGLFNEALILLGDFNDDVDVSTFGGRVSPYAAFAQHTLDDCAPAQPYCTVTRRLSDQRQNTTGGSEVIDHITISNELFADYLRGTVRIENPFYVPSYLSTTSDHYPVWARFDLARVTATEEAPAAGSTLLAGVYPNPARARLLVRTTAMGATVALFDVLGREVARADAPLPGEITLSLDSVAPGAYVLRVTAGARTESRPVVVAR